MGEVPLLLEHEDAARVHQTAKPWIPQQDKDADSPPGGRVYPHGPAIIARSLFAFMGSPRGRAEHRHDIRFGTQEIAEQSVRDCARGQQFRIDPNAVERQVDRIVE
ncbi:MAG: hypothetical protein IIB26_08675, partial [Chloroflexi bacterium]|nr:hypothetical protein [Chloroflexota bacterium]